MWQKVAKFKGAEYFRKALYYWLMSSFWITKLMSFEQSFLSRDIGGWNILCFTKTWLSLDTLSESVKPAGCSVHHADRSKYLSGKQKGGGVCFMINDSWCNSRNIQELKSFCSPDLEYLTIKYRPCYPQSVRRMCLACPEARRRSRRRGWLSFFSL